MSLQQRRQSAPSHACFSASQFRVCLSRRMSLTPAHERMMHTPLYSHTDQGICAGPSRWGTAPSCVSGSIGGACFTRLGNSTPHGPSPVVLPSIYGTEAR